MPAALIDTPYSRIRLRSERLIVQSPPLDGHEDSRDGRIVEMPIAELERLMLTEHVQITSQAMAALLRAKVPVIYLDGHGRTLGVVLSSSPAEGCTRLEQYRRAADAAFNLTIASRLVAAKLANQRRVLQKLDNNRPGRLQDEIVQLEGYLEQARGAVDLSSLRGFEGAATRCYFDAWGRFLPDEFPFQRRSVRPPHNPVNAYISFGSVLVYNELVSLLHRRGLDPAIGLLHSTENGRFALALDLEEPFRPALVEAFALRLFSHRMLGAEHFEAHGQGCYLNPAGRRVFLLHYEKRVQRKFILAGTDLRTTLRREMENQVLILKRALSVPEEFRGFTIP